MNLLILNCDSLITTLSGAKMPQHDKDYKVLDGVYAELDKFKKWNKVGMTVVEPDARITSKKYFCSLFNISFCMVSNGTNDLYKVNAFTPEWMVETWHDKNCLDYFTPPSPGMILHELKFQQTALLEPGSKKLFIGKKDDQEMAAKAKINFISAEDFVSGNFKEAIIG